MCVCEFRARRIRVSFSHSRALSPRSLTLALSCSRSLARSVSLSLFLSRALSPSFSISLSLSLARSLAPRRNSISQQKPADADLQTPNARLEASCLTLQISVNSRPVWNPKKTPFVEKDAARSLSVIYVFHHHKAAKQRCFVGV